MKYLILILSLFATVSLWSQEITVKAKGRVSNQDAGNNEGGVTVTIEHNGSVIATTTTASNGKYSIDGVGPMNGLYRVVYSKGGLVTKVVSFNPTGINEEDLVSGNVIDLPLDIELFNDRPNVDFDFLVDEPVAEFAWNAGKFIVDYNKSKAAKVASKINKLLDEADNAKEENEANYQKAIAAADGFYNEEKYEDALAKYEEAITYKPADEYANNRILELDALIQAQKEEKLKQEQADAAYNALIQAADNLRDAGNLEKAVSTYKEALNEKDEQYPKDQIADLEAKIEAAKKEAENQAAYEAAITKGDMFLKQNSLQAARDKYTEASELKPSEEYPKKKLAEIEEKLKAKEEQDAKKKQYDDAIAAADALFDEENYVDAKAKYDEALAIEAASTYAKGRSDVCAAKIKELEDAKALEEQIASLMKEGDDAVSASDYPTAESKYTEILGIDAANVEAQTKLADVKAKIEELKNQEALQAQIDGLMADGRAAMDSEDYDTAKSKFESVLGLKNDHAEAKAKLDEVLALIEAKNNAEALQAQIDGLMTEGISAMTAEDYPTAKSKFESVLALKSDHSEAQTKLDEVNALIAAQKNAEELQAQIDGLMAEGTTALGAEDYNTAKSKFEAVLALKTDHSEAQAKLDEVNALIEAKQNAEELQTKIDALLADGNAAMGTEDYATAESKFNEVLSLESGNSQAQSKLDEIKAIREAMDAESTKNEQIKSLLTEGTTALNADELETAKSKFNEVLGLDPTNSEAQNGLMNVTQREKELADLASKNEAFNNLVAEGDQAVGAADYATAISKYEQAIELNDTPEVQTKLQNAKDLLADASKAAENKAKYDEAIANGTNLLASEQLEEAKEQFKIAKDIDPSQSLPQEKIDEINKLIAEKDAQAGLEEQIATALEKGEGYFASSDWDDAADQFNKVIELDPNNSTAKNRLEDIAKAKADADKMAEFDSYLMDGKAFMQDEKYEDAKQKFEKAREIDPSNAELQALINEVNEKINEANSAEAEEEKFNSLKADGFALFDEEKYDQSKVKLNEALLIKNDAEIREKLEAIKKAEEALAVDAGKEQRYEDAMDEARRLEGESKLTEAIDKYKEAGTIKPEEVLPPQKVSELQNEIARLEKLDEDYDQAMADGEALMVKEEYAEAIKKFNEALSLKPTERLPVERANEAQRLSSLVHTDEDEVYEKILTVAEKKFDNGDYDKAKELANRALGIRPDDSRPATLLSRIEDVEKLNADYAAKMNAASQKASAEEYEAAIELYRQAEVLKPTETEPRTKIAELEAKLDELQNAERKEELYAEYLRDGDSYKTQKEYEQALSSYQNALNVKKGDKVAQNRIDEVQQIIDDLANAKKDDIAKRNEFDALIREADDQFSGKYYMPAKSIYEKALQIDNSSVYAKKQIEECDRLENLRTAQDEEREYQKIINAADKNFSQEDYDKAKEYYERALSVRKTDPYPMQKLAEIESILNPAIASSVMLEDLGDPFDNSVMDGQALLEKAEAQRKALKGNKVKQGFDNIQDKESARTSEKTAEHLENSNEIYRVQQMITRDDGVRDLNRQALVDALRASEIEREDAETATVSIEHATNVSDMETLDIVNREVALEYGDRTETQMQNADEMELFNRANSMRLSAEMTDEKEENLNANKELNKIQLAVDDGVRDDYAAREATHEAVFESERKANNETIERGDEKYASNLGNKEEINKIEEAVETRTVEDAKKSGENNLAVVAIASDVNATEIEKTDLKEAHLVKTDDQIRQVKIKMEGDATDRDNDRKEMVEIIKKGNEELAEANSNSYNEEMVKYVSNKEFIETEVTKNNGVDEKADAAHDRKVAYVKGIDKKAQIDYQDNQEGDEAARQKAKTVVDNSYQDVQSNADEEVEKRQANTEKLNDHIKTIQKGEENQTIDQKNKHLDNAQQLDKITDKPKEKTIVANELGEEYPEGVSQENFTQNDSDGLMKAIITRRIVVIEGHADVYVRTQTVHGTTYSKNGQPTLEHVWNKETQDPSLERHF